MNKPVIRALIAEDEPLLAKGLVKTLAKLWPELHICAVAHDGFEAVRSARDHLPDILFTDIRMPACSGLEAAEQIVDEWPDNRALPLIVFITAFDRFAIDAFERAAVDYVLKPVEEGRLAITCQRLMDRLAERQQRGDALALEPLVALLNATLGGAVNTLPIGLPNAAIKGPPLDLIQASSGTTLHMVAVDDVMFFEADDKYVRVVTADKTLFIRTPLRELLPRLEAGRFTQIHRGIAVRTSLIDRVVREDNGRMHLYLKGCAEKLAVSRSHAHLFRPM